MTHRPIKVLDDGTRVYAGYHRYKPMADEDRTNRVRKPADPRAVRFRGDWFLPLPVLPDKQRVLPVTVPDLSRDWPKHSKRSKSLLPQQQRQQ